MATEVGHLHVEQGEKEREREREEGEREKNTNDTPDESTSFSRYAHKFLNLLTKAE